MLALRLRPCELEACSDTLRCCVRLRVLGALVSASGHVGFKPALHSGAAACDLGFGRFGLSFRPCEREARFDVQDKAVFSKLEKGVFQKRS